MRLYKVQDIKINYNRKTKEAGTLDVVRGCIGCELKNAPCYAVKGCQITSTDFFSPQQQIFNPSKLRNQFKRYQSSWIRIGCTSDPSLDWNTVGLCLDILKDFKIKPVIITKLFNPLPDNIIHQVRELEGNIQISLSGIQPTNSPRLDALKTILSLEGKAVSRIISAPWNEGSKPYKKQRSLIEFSQKNKLPILETPLRIFKTSPFVNLIDMSKMHRHLSPISGKLDNQSCAGLILPERDFDCYSTCSIVGNEFDPGCKHQCLTNLNDYRNPASPM